MYAIVDIETTGGYAARNRICEIAIILHDGKKIVKEYQSLINPERSIPTQLTAIHGISDHMVEDAPKFFEEAKTIYELLEGNVFVAHSVNFDYSFVKAAFEELGFPIKLKKLCTVRLSRKIFPGLNSYSLGNLCENRGIKIHDRHRAYGDALATAELFTQLVENDTDNIIENSLTSNATKINVPDHLDKNVLDDLPEAAGVYYFLNLKNKIIYVGKAKNIKKRVRSHFTGDKKEVAKQAFQQQIANIDYYCTGTELLALLHESHEIRKHWPRYNRAQKNGNPGYSIFIYEDRSGYKRIQIAKKQAGMKSIIRFASQSEAFQFLNSSAKERKICLKMAGIQKSPTSCFDFKINLCDGACVGEESVDKHNEKVDKFIEDCYNLKSDYIILGAGRTTEEKSFIMVEEGIYKGFGFIENAVGIMSWDQLNDYLISYPDHPEIYKILNSVAATKNYKKVLKDEFNNAVEI